MAVLLTIARWLLVLPGSVLAGWVVGITLAMPHAFFYLLDPTAQTFWIWNVELGLGIVMAWAQIIAGVAIAPGHKKQVGYALAVLYSGVAWLYLLAMSQTGCEDCWTWFGLIQTIVKTTTQFITATLILRKLEAR